MRAYAVVAASAALVLAIACGNSGAGGDDGPSPTTDAGGPPVDGGAPDALDASGESDANADAGPTFPTRSYTRIWTRSFSTAARTGRVGSSAAEGVGTLALDDAGNIYLGVTGWNLASASSNEDWWLRKLDSDGNEVTTGWDKILDQSAVGGEHPATVLRTHDGSFLFAGELGAEPAATYADHEAFRRYDADGNEVGSWSAYEAIGEFTNKVVEAADGSVYALVTNGTQDSVRRFDADGTVDGAFSVAFPANEVVYDIATDAAGDIFAGGIQNPTSYKSTAAFVRKYAGDTGVLAWDHPITLPVAGELQSLIVLGDDILALGVDQGTEQTVRTIYPIKIARADGQPHQESWQTFSYAGGSIERSHALIDADGNLEVLVYDPGTPKLTTSVFRLRRFAPNGTTLSISTPLAEGFGADAMAFDQAGDLILGGEGPLVGFGDFHADTGWVLKAMPSP